jgi:hypothetical protein
VLPYVFPTRDERVVGSVVERAVAVDAPAPREVSRIATSFDALAELQRRSFFARTARVRICVLLTDGESRPFGSAEVGRALLASPPCRLVVVRFWSAGERIYDATGRVEPQYRPRQESRANVDALVSAAVGRAFDESQVESAARALRALAGTGPVTRVGIETSVTELAPYLALVGGLLAAVLVLVPLSLDLFVAFMQRPGYDRAQRA